MDFNKELEDFHKKQEREMFFGKGIREFLIEKEREIIYGKGLKDTIDNLIEKGKIKPYKEDFKKTLKNLQNGTNNK